MRLSLPWQCLGARHPQDLGDARLQLHWAAQLVSAVGTTVLTPAPDDSHTSLEWLAGPGMLAGRFTTDAPFYRVALRLAELSLCVLDAQDGLLAERPLDGLTLSQGIVWLEQEIAVLTKRSLRKPLVQPALELPEHTVGRGGRFCSSDTAALAEMGRWFANADTILRALALRTPAASPVRCWPHHFDIATLVTVGANDEPQRTIGVGMSPGDASYGEPYWYVTPWPAPRQPQPPALEGGGAWHFQGWFGAVLTGSTLVRAAAAPQAARVQTFLDVAVETCRTVFTTPTQALVGA